MKDDARDEEELRKLLEDATRGETGDDEWLATARAYDDLGEGLEADEREIVARALAQTPDPADRAAVHELLTRTRLETTAPARSHRLLWGLAALLAILVGGSFWMLQIAQDRLGEGEQSLSAGSASADGLELLAPIGTVPDWEDFRWTDHRFPPGARYRLVVSTGAGELFRVEGLRDSTYTPSLPERKLLAKNDSIRWRVEAYAADGERIAWGSDEAVRRSR